MARERPPLEEMTLRQLRKIASQYNISRYSRMRKGQLLAEIQKVEKQGLSNISTQTQEEQTVEAAKFDIGTESDVMETLASVDEGFGDLPSGYGESRIVLLPRDPQWCYAYWDIPNENKEQLRREGGQQLALRLYDVTDVDIAYQSPHSVQEYLCDELAREWYMPVPVSDRDYVIDIGYRCGDGRWLILARSTSIHVPPVYPSDWIEDVYVTVNWEEELTDKTVYELIPPSKRTAPSVAGAGAPTFDSTQDSQSPIYAKIFGLAQGTEAARVAGSLYGSMQQVPPSFVPEQVLSSYVFPSGVGLWAVPNVSGLTMSGVGMSGIGFGDSIPPIRPRQFWLVADAELIVYGATEPDATVTVGGRQIKLSPDGTFRFQMSFQDGQIDYPIEAVAVDGQQKRSIHMKFNRETPSRNTNTKDEAALEWLF